MLEIIAFDADDTLWDNEIYFRESEQKFYELMSDFQPKEVLEKQLYETEIRNIALYGYGIKSFTLSMIETIGVVTHNSAPYETVKKAMEIGREQISAPVTLLPDVVETLDRLAASKKYRILLVTKGDLLDQQRKLQRSGLGNYFSNVEILSDKRAEDYQALCARLQCKPEKMMMVGNSLKSDVLPIVSLGGYGVYVPYQTTWQHEVAEKIEHPNFYEITRLEELWNVINRVDINLR